jgi:hypothetical protein
MSIRELEEQLAAAQARLDAQSSRPIENIPAQLAVYEAVSSAQRALAAARGEEYAERLDVGFFPEAAVSEPVLLQTDHVAILTFSAVREKSDGMRDDAGYGVLEFASCSLTKFGYPNDEALPGHPLYKRGLSECGVFEVRNSAWVRLMTEQNRVAFPRTAESSECHFIVTFHDSTFECIARGVRAWLSSKPYPELFDEIRMMIFKPAR